MPPKWQYLNLELRKAGLSLPPGALEDTKGGKSKGEGSKDTKGGKSKGKGDKGGKGNGTGGANGFRCSFKGGMGFYGV